MENKNHIWMFLGLAILIAVVASVATNAVLTGNVIRVQQNANGPVIYTQKNIDDKFYNKSQNYNQSEVDTLFNILNLRIQETNSNSQYYFNMSSLKVNILSIDSYERTISSICPLDKTIVFGTCEFIKTSGGASDGGMDLVSYYASAYNRPLLGVGITQPNLWSCNYLPNKPGDYTIRSTVYCK